MSAGRVRVLRRDEPPRVTGDISSVAMVWRTCLQDNKQGVGGGSQHATLDPQEARKKVLATCNRGEKVPPSITT